MRGKENDAVMELPQIRCKPCFSRSRLRKDDVNDESANM